MRSSDMFEIQLFLSALCGLVARGAPPDAGNPAVWYYANAKQIAHDVYEQHLIDNRVMDLTASAKGPAQ